MPIFRLFNVAQCSDLFGCFLEALGLVLDSFCIFSGSVDTFRAINFRGQHTEEKRLFVSVKGQRGFLE